MFFWDISVLVFFETLIELTVKDGLVMKIKNLDDTAKALRKEIADMTKDTDLFPGVLANTVFSKESKYWGRFWWF